MKKFVVVLLCALLFSAGPAYALSSNNIPLDSPIYLYLEKLSGFGLISSDIRGIRPFSRREAARLLEEAEARLGSANHPPFVAEIVKKLEQLLVRETQLYPGPELAPMFDYALRGARLRYVYLDGEPRSYYRAVND
jgi:hypothetical protein